MTKAGIIWSVPVRIDDIPQSGRRFEIAADEATRRAVARSLALDAFPRLGAAFDVIRAGRDGLRVTGTVSATVGRTCVVTLEPVENQIEETVDLAFVPPGRRHRGAAARVLDLEPLHDDHEPAELLVDGTVDLGAIATEFLMLGLDPYPRKPGAAFEALADADPESGPFAALGALRTGTSRSDT